jgi:hypothetical protein
MRYCPLLSHDTISQSGGSKLSNIHKKAWVGCFFTRGLVVFDSKKSIFSLISALLLVF